MSRSTPDAGGAAPGTRAFLKQAVLAGTAIVVPVLVTAVVLLIGLDILSGLLDPLVIPIREALGSTQGDSPLLPQVIAAAVLLITIVLVGAYSESRGRRRIGEGVDATMARIPGIGSIYSPLNRISEMLLEGDTDNFQDVVLVEYPETGSYCVAFKTAEPPERIGGAVEHEDMITVFMPMGPNPFMGGFIMHVAPEQVHDVDLTVEEGITSIVSFGVAVESEDHAAEATQAIEDYEPER